MTIINLDRYTNVIPYDFTSLNTLLDRWKPRNVTVTDVTTKYAGNVWIDGWGRAVLATRMKS